MRDESQRPSKKTFTDGVEVSNIPFTDEEWDAFIEFNRATATEKILSSLSPEELEALLKIAKGE